MIKLILIKKIIGIGETGLDFYYNHSDKKDQIRCLKNIFKQLKLVNVPVIIHTRSAEVETIEVLRKHLKKQRF